MHINSNKNSLYCVNRKSDMKMCERPIAAVSERPLRIIHLLFSEARQTGKKAELFFNYPHRTCSSAYDLLLWAGVSHAVFSSLQIFHTDWPHDTLLASWDSPPPHTTKFGTWDVCFGACYYRKCNQLDHHLQSQSPIKPQSALKKTTTKNQYILFIHLQLHLMLLIS